MTEMGQIPPKRVSPTNSRCGSIGLVNPRKSGWRRCGADAAFRAALRLSKVCGPVVADTGDDRADAGRRCSTGERDQDGIIGGRQRVKTELARAYAGETTVAVFVRTARLREIAA